MTTRNSSGNARPKRNRRYLPPISKDYLGVLGETDAGWMLRGGTGGLTVVKVMW